MEKNLKKNIYTYTHTHTHTYMDFRGGPLVKTLPSNAVCVVLISGGGTKIPHALQPKNPKYKTETNILINSIKTIKIVHIKKIYI